MLEAAWKGHSDKVSDENGEHDGGKQGKDSLITNAKKHVWTLFMFGIHVLARDEVGYLIKAISNQSVEGEASVLVAYN
jgi:hypothetical protein